MCPAPGGSDLEIVGGVPVHGGAWHELGPLGGQQLLGGGCARHAGGLDGGLGGLIAAEVGGVHVHGTDDPGQGQTDQRPVVVLRGGVGLLGVRATAASGLPAVHDLALVAEGIGVEHGRFGPEQVLTVGEEFVVGVHHGATEPAVGQVDQAVQVEFALPVVGVGVTAGVGLGIVDEGIETGSRTHGAPVCVGRGGHIQSLNGNR